VDCILSPWLRDMTRPSIRTVQQPPAVEAWVTMNYFAPFELMKKQGALWPALFLVCLPEIRLF